MHKCPVFVNKYWFKLSCWV